MRHVFTSGKERIYNGTTRIYNWKETQRSIVRGQIVGGEPSSRRKQ